MVVWTPLIRFHFNFFRNSHYQQIIASSCNSFGRIQTITNMLAQRISFLWNNFIAKFDFWTLASSFAPVNMFLCWKHIMALMGNSSSDFVLRTYWDVVIKFHTPFVHWTSCPWKLCDCSHLFLTLTH